MTTIAVAWAQICGALLWALPTPQIPLALTCNGNGNCLISSSGVHSVYCVQTNVGVKRGIGRGIVFSLCKDTFDHKTKYPITQLLSWR